MASQSKAGSSDAAISTCACASCSGMSGCSPAGWLVLGRVLVGKTPTFIETSLSATAVVPEGAHAPHHMRVT
ncbi:MAG: hypothetical protein ACLQBX_09175 [Candidatus Limnocylindrales bacterium]